MVISFRANFNSSTFCLSPINFETAINILVIYTNKSCGNRNKMTIIIYSHHLTHESHENPCNKNVLGNFNIQWHTVDDLWWIQYRSRAWCRNSIVNIISRWEPKLITSSLGRLNPFTVAGIFLSLLIFLSVAGNILVCIAIYTERSLRRIGNLFLASLAIADLFVASLVMTFAGVNDLLGN